MAIPATFDENTLGGRLKRARLSRGVSAKTLETYVGGEVTRSVIANIESGRKSDLTTRELVILCRALDIRPQELVPELNGL
jgi:transcriptional regulator with XRE-family HTH domain